MLFKEWFSLDETATIINEKLALKSPISKKDIIDLALDGFLELCIRVKYLDNNQLLLYTEEVEVGSFLDLNKEKETNYFTIECTDTMIHFENGLHRAVGFFCLNLQETTFNFHNNSFSFYALGIYVDYEHISSDHLCNLGLVHGICFNNPVLMDLNNLLVSKKNVLNLVAEIGFKNKNANQRLNFELDCINKIELKEQAEIDSLKSRIAELESELERATKQPQNAVIGAVNHDDFSIYGHTTDDIKALFLAVKRFWINHDINEPDTIPNAGAIEEWIAKNTPATSDNNRKAIQRIIRPKEAKYIGSKGNNGRA